MKKQLTKEEIRKIKSLKEKKEKQALYRKVINK